MPPRGEAAAVAVAMLRPSLPPPSESLAAVAVAAAEAATQVIPDLLETPEAPERHLHSMLCRLLPGLLTR